MSRKFSQDFRHHFLRGLAAILPTVLTLMIIIFVIQFIYRNIGARMDVVVQWFVVQIRCILGPEPLSFRGADSEWDTVKTFWDTYYLQVVGIAMALLVIYIVGRLIASFLGRMALRALDQTLTQLPISKHLYPQIKQVTDYLFSDRRMQFSSVVAVQYPRKGAWSLGLVTAHGMQALRSELGEMVTVFIPSSPTPMTGYTVTVSREDIRELPLTIDEALRFTISGGVILPPDQMVGQDLESAESMVLDKESES